MIILIPKQFPGLSVSYLQKSIQIKKFYKTTYNSIYKCPCHYVHDKMEELHYKRIVRLPPETSFSLRYLENMIVFVFRENISHRVSLAQGKPRKGKTLTSQGSFVVFLILKENSANLLWSASSHTVEPHLSEPRFNRTPQLFERFENPPEFRIF